MNPALLLLPATMPAAVEQNPLQIPQHALLLSFASSGG
jgi:hypothetical protein